MFIVPRVLSFRRAPYDSSLVFASPERARFLDQIHESVSEGHPDKLADRISDRILDAFLELDPHACVACETLLDGRPALITAVVLSTQHDEDIALEDLRTEVEREIIDHVVPPGTDGDSPDASVLSRATAGG